MDKLKNFIPIKEVEFVAKNLPTRKILDPEGFCEFYEAFTKEIISSLHKSSRKYSKQE